MSYANHVITRHWRLALAVVGVALGFWIVYSLRGVVFPFALGVALAYILMPVISWGERRLPGGGWPEARRISLIVLAFLVLMGVLFLIGFFLYSALAASVNGLIHNAPGYTASALERLRQWLSSLREVLPPQAQQQVDILVQEVGMALGDAVRAMFMRGLSLIPTTVGFFFGLAALPMFLFYLLKDSRRLVDGFYSGIPPWAVVHTRGVLRIVDSIFGRYIRAQLVLGLVVGLMVLAGLLLLRAPFAPLLAVFAGLTEMIPLLGPWIGGVTGVIVMLALAPDKVVWVGILYIGVQLVENTFLVPKIQSVYLGIHPVFILVLLAVGAQLAGFWGIILAVPLAATAVRIYRYVQGAAAEEDRAMASDDWPAED